MSVLFGILLCQSHYSEEVLSPEKPQIIFGVPFPYQGTCKVYQFSGVGKSGDTSIAIEVCTYSHMFYTHHIDGMVDVFYGIKYGSTGGIA